MNTQKGRRMFGGIDVGQKSVEILSKLEAYLSVYFGALVDKFVECFEQYVQKITYMQQMGKKDAVAFINFSILRTNILAKKHFLRIDAYNQNWYSDRAECSSKYDVGEIYQWLEKFESVLEAARKNLGGSLKLADLQALIFEESDKYLPYVAEIIRIGMKKAAETESYQKMNRHEVFVVCVGSFQDHSLIVYKEDITEKDAKAVKLHLQAKQQVYAYEICEKLDLSGGDYEDIKIMFSSYSGCDFTGSSFKKSIMIGNSFHNAVLKDTNFEHLQAFDIDFSGAVLENVSFKGAKLARISFVGAKLIHVQFEGAILLENLNFENTELIETEVPAKQAVGR